MIEIVILLFRSCSNFCWSVFSLLFYNTDTLYFFNKFISSIFISKTNIDFVNLSSTQTFNALLMLKQTFLWSINKFLLLKHCQQLLQTYFLFFMFCFVKHKSVKILCTHNVTCCHQLQVTNPSSFQIFDMEHKLEKSVCFHNKRR